MDVSLSPYPCDRAQPTKGGGKIRTGRAHAQHGTHVRAGSAPEPRQGNPHERTARTQPVAAVHRTAPKTAGVPPTPLGRYSQRAVGSCLIRYGSVAIERPHRFRHSWSYEQERCWFHQQPRLRRILRCADQRALADATIVAGALVAAMLAAELDGEQKNKKQKRSVLELSSKVTPLSREGGIVP